MKIFITIFFFISLNSFSQNNLFEIEYICVRTLNFKVQTKDVLYYDVDKGICYYKEGKYETVEQPSFTLPENAILIADNDNSNKEFIYILFNENKLYDNTEPHKGYYTYDEEIPKIQWTITDEKKNKKNIELTKATTTFRGRFYEVWFSYEYPISVGPWKFQGLPGLIFEVIDQTEPLNYQWQLKKITHKKGVIPFTGKNLKNVITPTKFLQIFKEDYTSYSDVIMSRSNVEYEPASFEEREESFNKYRLLKREIKYEWEE